MMLRASGFSSRGRRAGIGVVAMAAALVVAVAAVQADPLPQKTLAECIAIALEHHPTLKAATASIAAAGERIWVAASPYLPQVDASYEVQRQRTSVGARTGTDMAQGSPTLQTNNLYT